MMGTRTNILGQALLVGFKGRPIDEALMMVADEDGPFRARSLFEALAQPPAVVDVTDLLGSAIDVNTGVEWVGKNLMDLGVGRRDPAYLLKPVRV